MKRLANYFLQGLLFLAPVALTIWVLVGILKLLDRIIPLPIPGLGIVVVLALVTLFGFLASNFLTRGVLTLVDSMLDRLPFVKLLYSSIKDLLGAFVGEKKRFDKPVAVELAPGGVRAFGFVTRDNLEALGLPGLVAVYFPQAYNFAGQVVAVPSASVMPVSAESGAVMTFIVSGGVAGIR